jgi:hypothetical protein
MATDVPDVVETISRYAVGIFNCPAAGVKSY